MDKTTLPLPAPGLDPRALAWTSVISRAAIASMYAATSIRYLVNGTAGVLHYTERQMAHTWLPMPIVSTFGRAIPWLELVIWLWLLVGYRLRTAWVATALYTVILGFGNMLALQNVNDYLHVLLCLAGLLTAAFDPFSVDAWRRRHP